MDPEVRHAPHSKVTTLELLRKQALEHEALYKGAMDAGDAERAEQEREAAKRLWAEGDEIVLYLASRLKKELYGV